MKINISDIKIGNRYRKDIGDLTELCESIKEQGLLQPIGLTKEHELVFGQRRIEAYKKLGYKDIDAKIVDVTSIVEGEHDENSVRKAFLASERLAIAEAIKKALGERRGRPFNSGSCEPELKGKESRDLAAKEIFDSTAEYRRTKKVVSKGTEELIKAMDEEVIDITSAAKLADKPKEEQKKIIKAIKSGEAKSVTHAINLDREKKKVEQYKKETSAPIINHESYVTWLDKQESCDCILTDPPYITEFKSEKDHKEFVSDFMNKCIKKLKPSGSMYVCIGAYPLDTMARWHARWHDGTMARWHDGLKTYLNLDIGLELKNILVWTYNNTIGAQSDKKYIQNYQCVLYYSNNTAKIYSDSINDKMASFTINAPDGRQGNRYHTWQKPDELADRFILNSTKDGDTILDPFSCTGTFILAANRLGRIGKGCDISEENIKIAIKRGCELK